MVLSIKDFLESNPLFQGFDKSELEKIAAAFTWKIVPTGGKVFEEGDEGDSLYMVARGVIAIKKKMKEEELPVLLAELGPQSLFGEMAILESETRSATAEATEPTHLVVLTREQFVGLLMKEPPAGLSFLLRICRLLSLRLRMSSESLVDASDKLGGFRSKVSAPKRDAGPQGEAAEAGSGEAADGALAGTAPAGEPAAGPDEASSPEDA